MAMLLPRRAHVTGIPSLRIREINKGVSIKSAGVAIIHARLQTDTTAASLVTVINTEYAKEHIMPLDAQKARRN